MAAEGTVHQSLDTRLNALWLTIDNPSKANAMSVAMIRSMADAIRQATQDDDIKSIVIAGEGSHLTSGSDASETFDYLTEVPGGATSKVLSQRARQLGPDQLFWGPDGLFTAIIESPKLVVLEAKGACLEIGLYLTLVADVVVASDQCEFGNPKWSYIGADGDFSMLTLAVGLSRMKEMLFLGTRIDAQEAIQWGLIERAVPAADLRDEVTEVTRKAKTLYRDGITSGKFYLRATMDAMQVGTGMSYGTIMAGLTTNLAHRGDEFNFVKARRDRGTSAALREGRRLYEAL